MPDFELLREIGRGSYGSVWLARGVTGLFRALKVVGRANFEDPEPYEREFRGITEFAAVSLASPRQLALLHVGRNDAAGFFYYVMELADDVETGREIDPARYRPRTLKELRQSRRRMPAADAVALGVELAEGLAELHRRGLVHRDIKPSNVIFVGGAARLADPGLVASARAGNATLSRVGNPGYMPPDFPGVPSADVYGLGKVLYELVSDREREDFPRLPADLASLPDRKALLELNEILLRACAPQPERRYPDATALLEELRLLQAGKSVRRLRAAERHLSRALRAAAFLAVAAAVAGSGAWIEHRRAADETARRHAAEVERDLLARQNVYSAGLARAQRALENRSHGLARRILTELAPQEGVSDLRGFEWHALWREARGDATVVLQAQGAVIHSVHFSPDGKLAAAHTNDRSVVMWDAVTRKEIRRFEGVGRLAGFSTDSRWLVGSGPQASVQRWRVEGDQRSEPTAKGVHRPLASAGVDRVISFADGGAGVAHRLVAWNFERAEATEMCSIASDTAGTRWDFYRGAVAPDGSRAALSLITGRSHEARWKLVVIDLVTGEIQFEEATRHRITAIAFANKSARLACAFGNTAEIAVLDLDSRAWSWRDTFGAGQTNAIAFSPDDQLLAVGGRDSAVQLVEAGRGTIGRTFLGHEAGLETLAWHPSGEEIISGGSAGDARIWAARAPADFRNEWTDFWRPAGGGRRVCLSADGKLLAATDDPEVGARLVRMGVNESEARIQGMFMPRLFSADGERLYGSRSDGSWETWGCHSPPQLIDRLPLFSQASFVGSGVGASPDGRVVGAGNSRGVVVFWDMPNRRRLVETGAHRGAVWFVAIAPGGDVAVSGGEDLKTNVWQPFSGARLAALTTPAPVWQATFSPDGQWLALALQNGRIEIHQLPALQKARTLQTGSSMILNVAFSSDGRRLAGAGSDGAVHIFDPSDWREITTLQARSLPRGGDATVADIGFSTDNSTLAAYLNDGRIRVWRK